MRIKLEHGGGVATLVHLLFAEGRSCVNFELALHLLIAVGAMFVLQCVYCKLCLCKIGIPHIVIISLQLLKSTLHFVVTTVMTMRTVCFHQYDHCCWHYHFDACNILSSSLWANLRAMALHHCFRVTSMLLTLESSSSRSGPESCGCETWLSICCVAYPCGPLLVCKFLPCCQCITRHVIFFVSGTFVV